MLRYFQIVSNALAFVAGIADFEFPTRTKGHARCAVVGWDVQPVAGATRAEAAYGARATNFQIGSRNYVQGDAVNMGLVCPVPVITDGVGNDLARGPAYFPGERIVHPNGQLSGGMPIHPGERILMRIASPGAELNRVILQCVQFDCGDNFEGDDGAQWRALIQEGIGEVVIWGHQLDYTGAALNAEEFEAQPRAPIANTLRRQQTRGVTTQGLIATTVEQDFARVTAELFTQTNRPPHNQAVPARSVMSYGGYLIPGAGRVDLVQEEKAYARVNSPIPAGNAQMQLAQFFEGRPTGGRMLNSADAVS